MNPQVDDHRPHDIQRKQGCFPCKFLGLSTTLKGREPVHAMSFPTVALWAFRLRSRARNRYAHRHFPSWIYGPFEYAQGPGTGARNVISHCGSMGLSNTLKGRELVRASSLPLVDLWAFRLPLRAGNRCKQRHFPLWFLGPFDYAQGPRTGTRIVTSPRGLMGLSTTFKGWDLIFPYLSE